MGSAESFDLGKFVDLLCSNDPEQNPVPIIPASLKTQVLRLWKHGQQSQELIWADSSCSTEMSDILPTDQAEAKVFAWLRLGPQIGSKCFEALHRCFPGSLPGDAIMARTAAALEPYGIDGTNVIYGQSICSDEINNEPGDLSQLMTTYFGNCFPMGGIGGAPYVGKTGFGAFSGHVPDDGHVVILFGPHIAVSEDGELGMYLRDGQCKHTSACGAVLAAYNACNAGNDHCTEWNGLDHYDMQQTWLQKKLQKRLGEINSSDEPLQVLIHAAYEAIRDKLLKIVNTSFGTGKLVLIGGIQLNMPQPCVDHFLPLFFQMQSRFEGPINLLPQFQIPQQQPDQLAVQALSTFSWLRLSPPPASKCFEALHKSFPNALPGDAIMARTAAALEPYGIDGTNVIYGQSICSDEINNEPGDLSQLMTTYFGNCFPMGGIGGAPYVGKTGFGAFSGHVPDDGHVVILFGPHIAVSEDGELGMYLRDGQCKHTSACGAVLAAYQQCKAGQLPFDVDDMQQSWLREKLQDRITEIDQHEMPMAALIHAAYEAIRDKLLSIVNIGFGTRKLVLIGGIQLNMPQPCVDHFLPLFFQMQSADQSPVDLLPEMLLSSLIEK